VATAFATAWGPFVMRADGPRRRDLRVRALPAVCAVAGAAFLWLVLFGDELVDVLGGSEFESADRAVPGIALGWLGWTVAVVLQTELAVSRRTGVIAVVTSVAAVVNVGANLLLIPPFGFVGAAWATALSFGLLAAIYAVYERRLSPAPYPLGTLAVVAATVGAASAALLTPNVIVRTAAAAAATVVLAALARRQR
jgi:O-antigen/teichoic acid export membrane protein